MITVEMLKNLLDVEGEELKEMDSEKLRLVIGIFRYAIRQLERELYSRDANADPTLQEKYKTAY